MNGISYQVCLIEDDQIMGEALTERLALEGFACDWFQAGLDALPPLCRKPYDIAISDIGLPDVDWGQLFTRLTEAGVPLPPFIFITGRADGDSASRLLKTGAEEYLSKPLNIDVLIEKMRAICARSAGRSGHNE